MAIQSAFSFYELISQYDEHENRKKTRKQKKRDEKIMEKEIERNISLRRLDISQQYVPDCFDFVVYLLKRPGNPRALRLFQCRCDVKGEFDMVQSSLDVENELDRKSVV